MTKSVYDQYVNDGWKVFALYATNDDNKKVKGDHGTPKGWNDMSIPNSPYHPDAVYGGVPPRDIVAIDWDIKNGRKGDQSFMQLGVDCGVILQTVVRSPSGGGHAYLRIDPTILLAKAQSNYPDIDFQSYGKEWVKLGGQDGYTFTDEDFEYFVNPPCDISFLETRKEYSKEGAYAGVDADLHFMERPPIGQMQEYLDKLDPNMSYEGGWQNVIMALNSWDLGGDVGLQLAIDWSQKSTQYSATEEEITAKYEVCVPETPSFYLKLMGMAHKSAVSTAREKLTTVETLEEFEALAASIALLAISAEDRATLAEEFITAGEDIKFYGKKRGVAIKKMMAFSPKKEEVEYETPISIHLHGNNYAVRYGNDLLRDLNKTSVGNHLASFGIKSKDERDMLIANATPITNIIITPDYTTTEKVIHTLDKSDASNMFVLTQRVNPLFDLPCDFEEDEDIIAEFSQGVWGGKIEDIVRLTALSIKYGESKLNRLMLVAPSDAGKTEIATILKFQKINMRRLLSGMRGDKGVGGGVLEGIKATGLLLIDEANTALEQEIKDMDKALHIDQFGSGGTQIIPLLFTILTSTHKTATRNNSDELYNRFLQVELLESEMSHTVRQGRQHAIDKDRYTNVVQSYVRRLFKDTIRGGGTRDELKALQDKYRLPTNNDLDEVLFEISEKIIKDFKSKAREGIHSDYILRKGTYYAKRKKDIHDTALDLLTELSGLDHGKYAEKLTSHFVGERSTIKIDNTPLNYYQLNLSPFGENEDQSIINQFDDLDVGEL